VNKKIRSEKRRLRKIFIIATTLIIITSVIIIFASSIIFKITGVLTIENVNDLGLWLLIAVAIASIIIGSFLAVLVTRQVLYPISQLIDGLDKLSQGEYNARLQFSEKSGMINISNAFNLCAEELEKTEILRSDFINNFSHEFKTPISAINGFVKLLERDDLPLEKQRKYLEIIREETERLTDMTTNILTITKVESQGILTNKEEFYLSEQIITCGLLLEKKWKEKKLELIFDFDDYLIFGNEELLKQVWINLIDNAIKFAKKNSKIIVQITDEDEHLKIKVENEGETIKKEDMDRIFLKFYQSENSPSRSGNGIGLAIVKHIVTLHNGKVSVTSENGKTTFFVELPKHIA